MKQVFLLFGHAGCYEEQHEWTLGAYEDEAVAQRIADRINAEVLEYGSWNIDQNNREKVIQHFADLGFPEGVIPGGSLDEVRFSVYAVPYTAKAF